MMATKISLNKTQIRLWTIIVVAVILSLLVGGAIGTFVLAPKPVSAQTVHNLFVDLNGDGKTDLILVGSVLWNVPLAQSTPTPVALP